MSCSFVEFQVDIEKERENMRDIIEEEKKKVADALKKEKTRFDNIIEQTRRTLNEEHRKVFESKS